MAPKAAGARDWYQVAARNATFPTVDEPMANFWNPSADVMLYVVYVAAWLVSGGASGLAVSMRRSTTRGTAGSTVTPDVDNHYGFAVAPPSGAVLDLSNYTANPSFDAAELGPAIHQGAGTNFRAATYWYKEPGLAVPPGTGLIFHPPSGTSDYVADFTFIWQE